MEKNYCVRVWERKSGEQLMREDFERLDQAMIRVKTKGHELDQEGKQPKYYTWMINYTPDKHYLGDIHDISGSYDVNFFPLIHEISDIKGFPYTERPSNETNNK